MCMLRYDELWVWYNHAVNFYQECRDNNADAAYCKKEAAFGACEGTGSKNVRQLKDMIRVFISYFNILLL